jgi:peptidoglycan hydrolase-like protein with peptidoglycan-binding domain
MGRRLASLAVSVAAVVAVAAVAFWAGMNAVVPPELPIDEHPATTYAVETGTVSRALELPVTAAWSTTSTLPDATEGTITSVAHSTGSAASAGDVLLTIDLEPVVVAKGTVPMFRRLERGVRGPDVAQLQQLLRDEGFLAGPADGAFGPVTEAAVKRWQRATRATVDGVVDQGDLLFISSLPVRMAVVPATGDRVVPGSELVHVLGERPTFRALISASQRREVATGMTVSIAGPGGAIWRGTLGTVDVQPDGRYTALLGGNLCGDDCQPIAVTGETELKARIELVPVTAGIVVPTSALVLQPSGGVAVTLADGTLVAVRTIAEADGFAVVEGLVTGQRIRLPEPP